MGPRVVILAAGASRRLGEPKALVDLPGGRPVTRLVRAAREACGEDPLVITGAHHAEITAALAADLGDAAPASLFNPGWQAGRTGGLLLASRHAPGRDLCVLPVDHPRVDAALLTAIFDEWAAAGAPPRGWLAPGHASRKGDSPRPGHPIVIGRELAAGLESFGPDRPLRDLRATAEPLWLLPTDEVCVLENLDRPADLEEIRRADADG